MRYNIELLSKLLPLHLSTAQIYLYYYALLYICGIWSTAFRNGGTTRWVQIWQYQNVGIKLVCRRDWEIFGRNSEPSTYCTFQNWRECWFYWRGAMYVVALRIYVIRLCRSTTAIATSLYRLHAAFMTYFLFFPRYKTYFISLNTDL